MKTLCVMLLIAIVPIGVYAVDEKEPKLWVDGKVTPEQPYKAKVVAAGGLSPWSGETVIYLREDVKNGRYLETRIGFATGTGVRYTPIKNKAAFDKIVEGLNGYGAAIFIDPVEVSRFVWASPLGGVGSIFGDEDLVKMACKTKKKPNKAEQHGVE